MTMSRNQTDHVYRTIVRIFLFLAVLFSHPALSAAALFAGDWPVCAPEEQGMDSGKLADMLDYIARENLSIDSISIVRNGKMVMDAVYYPYTNQRKHNLFSCTKSILSALIGIAVDKGYIKSAAQPIADFFQAGEMADLKALGAGITLENLLTMTSGLDCKDSYAYQWSGLAEMRKSSDWTRHILGRPMAVCPGKRFEYCNGNSQLLSAILQKASGMGTAEFARKNLFEPLGIKETEWKTSPKGIPLGYAGLWLRPHDLAKIGQLYLNKGKWGDRQILSPEWIAVSTQGQVDADIYRMYGYHWWVDATRFLWFDTHRYFIAVGSNGQCLYVLPDKNLVVVITANMKEKPALKIVHTLFHDHIVPALTSNKTLPPNDPARKRLTAGCNAAAQPKDCIWRSATQGIARDGVFKRASTPAFSFAYPVMSHKAETKTENQIMRMYFDVDAFAASVMDIPEGTMLDRFVPDVYVNGTFLKNASDIQIVGHQPIVLACGTPAYKTQITWRWNNSLPITTFVVSACKQGKCVLLEANAWKHHDKLESIVQTLAFK